MRAARAAVGRPEGLRYGRAWLILTLSIALGAVVIAQDVWTTYHGDNTGRRHSPLTQITPANVHQITLVWAFATGDTSQIKGTPIVANGIVYSISGCSGGNCIVARDPANGNALWTSEHIGSPHWQSPIIVNGVVYVIDNSSKLWAFGFSTPPDMIFANGFDG